MTDDTREAFIVHLLRFEGILQSLEVGSALDVLPGVLKCDFSIKQTIISFFVIYRSSVFIYIHLQVKLPLFVFEVSIVDSLVKWGIHDS